MIESLQQKVLVKKRKSSNVLEVSGKGGSNNVIAGKAQNVNSSPAKNIKDLHMMNGNQSETPLNVAKTNSRPFN